MWRRFLFIINLFYKNKFIFKNPEKHELVIFDDISLFDIENLLFKYNFFVLQTRIEKTKKVYLTLKIIKYVLKNYNGNLMTAYLVSLLEIINPKIVITNIHNSLKFYDVAKILDKKIIFIAIQNGAQYEIKKYKHLYKSKRINFDLSKKIYIPNFFCFGQFEIDQHKKNNINIKNFFKTGSLNAANFFHHIKKNKIELKKNFYDICLLSDYVGLGVDKEFGLSTIEKGFAQTIRYTIEFCKKHNMKMTFAWKRDTNKDSVATNDELNFYKKYFSNDEINFLLNNSLEKKDRFMSYKVMFESKIVVATYSTLLREYLATGGKILSCNLTSSDIFDFPIEGICSIKDCTFQEFEKKLLSIFSMSEKEYFEKLGKDKNYLMEYDTEISATEKIRKKIDSLLEDNEIQSNF